jgi:hypothetical protein
MMDTELKSRIEHFVRFWRVAVTRTQETNSSVLAFGTRDRDAVVLKIVKRQMRSGWPS